MSVDRNVVGRIGEDEVGLPTIHGEAQDGFIPGIAADQPMRAEDPHLPRARHGLSFEDLATDRPAEN